MRQRGLARWIKRGADCALAGTALAVTAPVLAVTAMSIRATMGGPVVFRQERAGLHGVPFRISKFRTMTDARGPSGELLDDAQRLTRLGSALRRLSIDELPQLVNVLRGDMSLVGPRPLLVRYLPRYSPRQARRHDVLPGITGWAQVHGRNAIGWSDKLERDVWYVEHWSPLLDARILAKTLVHIIAPTGVSAEGHATMPEFMGTEGED